LLEVAVLWIVKCCGVQGYSIWW